MKSENQLSRRSFIKNSSAAAAISALSGIHMISGKEKGTTASIGKLNESCLKFMELFDLKYPIVQAAPGGEELAIAVANSGGLGAVSLGWMKPDEAYRVVSHMREMTKGNFYGNFVLHFEPSSLDKSLEAGCPTIQFSWGIPSKEIVSKIKDAGAKLGIQVSSQQGALRALERSPDFLICQGLEAGGHLQATSNLYTALDEVLKVAKDVPVLASGGVSTGHDIRKAINAGAAGTILGTRLIATQEGNIHDTYKDALVNAGEDTTVYTNCFTLEGNAMHRKLKNKTFMEWEAAGCPLSGNKPGEGDIIATHLEQGDVIRYSATPPEKGHKGALNEMIMYAGQGVKNVNDIPKAAELINRLWEEFENK